MTAILPPPTEIAVGLGGWLDETGLPDVFVGFEPLPGPPVDRPADPAARAIAAVAEASTLKVSAATCGLSSVGTGFVVAYDYVVTNAHVVAGAGARGVRVTAPGGRALDAVPVLFDPDLDVAVLHVVRLAVPPLAFAAKDPARGAVGAALGYPGGGALTIVPAAVSAHFAATGLDIYGVSKVRRQVLELRAEIDRGDSGGPFILTDGTVGGVIFAEAKTNQDIGYALSAREVAARIAQASVARPPWTPASACAPSGESDPADLADRRPACRRAPRVGLVRTSTRPSDQEPQMSTPPPASDPAKRHSAALTDGPDRAAARAMLKAIGFSDEDLAKPLVGVATNWIETMPCNYNQRRLAEHVKAGIRAAGGTPMEFNTIAVSDGVSMGTEGMKAILDQPRGHRRLDRAGRSRTPARRPGLPGRLRQDRSRARRWPSAASTSPAWSLYNGTIYPGIVDGVRNATVVTVFEAIGAYRAGKITLERLYEVENAACPGPGACGGQFTANTMSTVLEFIGPLAGRPQRHPGRGPGQGRRRPRGRRAGDGPRPARRAAVVDRHPPLARERDRQRRGDRRLDQRRPPPPRHRPRVRHPARHRRVRRDRRPDPGRRRHAAGRPLHRHRHVRGRRRRARHARAAQATGPPPRR